jgi:hypothetical protein
MRISLSGVSLGAGVTSQSGGMVKAQGHGLILGQGEP